MTDILKIAQSWIDDETRALRQTTEAQAAHDHAFVRAAQVLGSNTLLVLVSASGDLRSLCVRANTNDGVLAAHALRRAADFLENHGRTPHV